MLRFICISIGLLSCHLLYAQTDSVRTNPLDVDVYLHPVDCITAYTLPKGEWIYGQSLQTLPFPSWMFYGITDKLTTQIDLLPWIGGFVTELKKPIPSLNLRYQFVEQHGAVPSIAFEAMFIYFWDTLDRFETVSTHVYESGVYWHFKPVMSYQFGDDWYVHTSVGADYIGALIMETTDTVEPVTRNFTKSWNPNAALGVDYRPSPFISYHIACNYGATLTFLENVPRKFMFTYGFRVAPFYKNRFGILRSMRIELLSINGYFPDLKTYQGIPVPIYPYIYWQWQRRP